MQHKIKATVSVRRQEIGIVQIVNPDPLEDEVWMEVKSDPSEENQVCVSIPGIPASINLHITVLAMLNDAINTFIKEFTIPIDKEEKDRNG